MSRDQGGKTKPFKQPNAENKEYDEIDKANFQEGEEKAPKDLKAKAKKKGGFTGSGLKKSGKKPGGPNLKSKEGCSGVEHHGSKKKMKIPCQFYANGWCIKGNSCRFLHIKDGSDATLKSDLSNEGFPRVPGIISSNAPKECSSEDYFCAPLSREGFAEMDPTCVGNFLSCSGAPHYHHSGSTSNEDKMDMVSHGKRLLEDSMTNQRFSFNFTPWNKNLHAAENISGTLGRCRDSFLAFPMCGSTSQNHQNVDGEPTVHDAKFTCFAWDPSVPFEPSHALTRNLLMKEFPQGLRSIGIGETGMRDELFNSSTSDQVSSAKDLTVRSNGSAEKDNFGDGVQTGETVGAQLLSTSCDNVSRVDTANNELEDGKVDPHGNKGESKVGSKGEDQLKIEANALMYFKTALAEYVKDLVKPTWHEGMMSKDAYKLIVKKSVDKVMGTLQPYQIPVTDESVKLYLSASHSKLAKLVEAYIEIYGKS